LELRKIVLTFKVSKEFNWNADGADKNFYELNPSRGFNSPRPASQFFKSILQFIPRGLAPRFLILARFSRCLMLFLHFCACYLYRKYGFSKI